MQAGSDVKGKSQKLAPPARMAYYPSMAKPLSGMEQAFAHAYVKDPNPTRAARAAGYAVPKVAGWRAVRRPHVMAYVKELSKQARKKVRIKQVNAEVISPVHPVIPQVPLPEAESAVASRAEVLAMATNVVRARAGDYLMPTMSPAGLPTVLTDVKALMNAPVGVVADVSKDESGDVRLRLGDPLKAGKLLLDDHNRARSDEDPMARPRVVMNTILFRGSEQDRDELRKLALRMAKISPNGGGPDGDGR